MTAPWPSYICQAFHAVMPATSDYSRILIDKRFAWGKEWRGLDPTKGTDGRLMDGEMVCTR